MAELIKTVSISSAWVLAMEHLVKRGGTDSNLIMAIAPGGTESASIRYTLDKFLEEHASPRIRGIRKVADTIFPVDFYHGPPGELTRQYLYRSQQRASKIERRFIRRGTYFDRLIDWPGGIKTEDELSHNQLERRIRLLKRQWDCGKRTANAYELAVSTALPIEYVGDEDIVGMTGDLRIQSPLLDNFTMGFPCLSHISLTLFSGRLDLTAVYRNQHYITKAYGNFVGLSDLQQFICREVGCNQGDLVCVATHADAQLGKIGVPKRDILDLVTEGRKILDAADG